MKKKKKGLFGIFGLGGFSIAGEIATPSVPFLEPIRENQMNSHPHTAGCVRYDFVRTLADSKDMYYLLADSLNWCCIEIYTGKITTFDLLGASH
jgi:hypothetical protein